MVDNLLEHESLLTQFGLFLALLFLLVMIFLIFLSLMRILDDGSNYARDVMEQKIRSREVDLLSLPVWMACTTAPSRKRRLAISKSDCLLSAGILVVGAIHLMRASRQDVG